MRMTIDRPFSFGHGRPSSRPAGPLRCATLLAGSQRLTYILASNGNCRSFPQGIGDTGWSIHLLSR